MKARLSENFTSKINNALKESETLSEEAFDTFDTFEEFEAALKHAGGLYGLVGDKAHHMSTELLKEIALNAIYHANADESIVNDLKERYYNA